MIRQKNEIFINLKILIEKLEEIEKVNDLPQH